MDASLLKERENFKRRAMSMPVIEKPISKKSETNSNSNKRRPPKRPKHEPSSRPPKEYDYKTQTMSSQQKFSILAKVVKYLKKKHQEGDLEALNIDEILDETNQLDIGQRQKHWLITEALSSNPKVDVVDGDRYKFKPIYKIQGKKGLMKLLEKHSVTGQGSILLDDVEESLPNCAKVLKNLGDLVWIVTRPIDKKQVLYLNDKSVEFSVSEDIQKLWRSVTVEGMDETKIEEYLQKQNIATMQDLGLKKQVQRRKKAVRKKAKQFKTHNEHLNNILKDYSEK